MFREPRDTRQTRSQWHRRRLGTTECDGKAMCYGSCDVWFRALMTKSGCAKDAVAKEMLGCSWDMAPLSSDLSHNTM